MIPVSGNHNKTSYPDFFLGALSGARRAAFPVRPGPKVEAGWTPGEERNAQQELFVNGGNLNYVTLAT
jgi:hypothetical protein